MKEETELSRLHIDRPGNEASSRITRRAIQSAMIRLMGEQPYEDVRISDIINQSGVSRATFYRHYKAKEEVILDFCAGIQAKIERKMEEEQFQTDLTSWYTGFFRDLLAHQEDFTCALDAGINPRHCFPSIPDGLRGEARFELAARQSAFAAILTEWFRGGTRERPEEMGALCAKLLHVD